MAPFTRHGREQAELRDASEADVDSALTNRVFEGPDSRPRCTLVRGFDTKGELLEVVLNEHHDVVTVYR